MTDNTDVCTLRILHLPPSLSNERRDELFKQYGAVKTRTIRKSEKYTTTFVEFPSKELAADAFTQLHQLKVKGHRLSVEYAKRNVSQEDKENTVEDAEAAEKETDLTRNKIHFQKFLKKLNSWAPHHLFTQPVPPNLRYKYPAPTRETLLRIAIQLVKEPAFYTQVLHLMNKMNLPPPFEGLDEEFPMVREAYDVENYKELLGVRVDPDHVEEVAVSNEQEEEKQDDEDDDEEESEIESDKETSSGPQLIIPEKRKRPQSKKRLKIPKFVNPLKQPVAPTSSGQKHRPEDLFEVPRVGSRSQKIVVKPVETTHIPELTTSTENQSQFVVEPSGSAEGFGRMFPVKKANEEEDKHEEPKQDFITTEQLHDNRISANDQRVLSVFKNYHPGKPSCRLYIKNLTKQVEESDLHFIYRRYVLPSSSESQSEFNVRLMQEGRMKGQAFVTLPNIAQAQLALSETNGYILKDKPMVVQFAKVARN